jgi:hypothetical protein
VAVAAPLWERERPIGGRALDRAPAHARRGVVAVSRLVELAATRPEALTAEAVQRLQSTAGNAAVARLLANTHAQAGGAPAPSPDAVLQRKACDCECGGACGGDKSKEEELVGVRRLETPPAAPMVQRFDIGNLNQVTTLSDAAIGALASPGDTTTSAAQNAPPDEACLPGYTMCDFIEKRISVQGQYALYELYSRGGSECRDAIQMLSATRSEQIQGIFKADEAKPALLARRHGTGWWALHDHQSSVPKGDSAFVFEGEAPPMVVFRANVAGDRKALATALHQAWIASSMGGSTITVSPPSMKSCAPAPPIDKEKTVDPVPGKEECPPGMIPDPTGEFCLLPGKVDTTCTESEMSRAFQSAQDSCAGIKTGIDLLCLQGASPCDVTGNSLFKRFGAIFKNLCKLLGDDPSSVCNTPRAKFYEDCTVGSVIGSKGTMSCFPGSNQEISEKYKQWPGRIK